MLLGLMLVHLLRWNLQSLYSASWMRMDLGGYDFQFLVVWSRNWVGDCQWPRSLHLHPFDFFRIELESSVLPGQEIAWVEVIENGVND